MSSRTILTFSDVEQMALKYNLPLDSPLWKLKRNSYNTFDEEFGSGQTIAWYMALCDKLPLGFVETYMDSLFIHPDDYGITPAHWYVRSNILPLEFPHWGIADQGGFTIAHVAADYGNLPDGFDVRYPDLWSKVTDETGHTVEMMYLESKKMFVRCNIPIPNNK